MAGSRPSRSSPAAGLTTMRLQSLDHRVGRSGARRRLQTARICGQSLPQSARKERRPGPAASRCGDVTRPEEALQLFEAIKDNFMLSQVFFELARETPAGRAAPPLHALNTADLLCHTRLSDGDRLADCLTAINSGGAQ
jgi:hypothetical protein